MKELVKRLMWKDVFDKIKPKLNEQEIEELEQAYLNVTKRIEKAWDDGYKAGSKAVETLLSEENSKKLALEVHRSRGRISRLYFSLWSYSREDK